MKHVIHLNPCLHLCKVGTMDVTIHDEGKQKNSMKILPQKPLSAHEYQNFQSKTHV